MPASLLIVVLSLGLQIAASAIAFGVALRTRRVAFVLFALGLFLMAVRRAFSLHGLLLSGRPLDTGAEVIALGISALLLAGAIGLRGLPPEGETAPDDGRLPDRPRRLEATALVLGGLAIVGAAGAGYKAYGASRNAIMYAEARGCGALATAIGARADLGGRAGRSRAEIVGDLAKVWDEVYFEGTSYLCVVDSGGRLALNTHRPEAAGLDVGSSHVGQGVERQTLLDLIAARRDYQGPYRAPSGEQQIAAFAYSEALDGLVAVHVPLSVVESRVRAATAPWAITWFVAVAAFFPLGLFLLDWGYRSAERTAREAHRALADSERSLALALDAGGMGSFDWDASRDRIHWTEGHARLCGLPLQEFDGTYATFASRVHPQDLPALEAAVETARRSRQPYQQRFRVVWPDGSVHWIEGKGGFYYDSQGEALRMVGVVTDVSRETLAKESLASRARQQAAVATLGQAALGGTPIPELLDQAARLLVTVLELDCSKVLELLPDQSGLLLRAGVGWSEGLVGRETVPATTESQAGYTLLQAQPVVVEDLARERRFSGPELLLRHGVVSGMSVVIPGQRGQHPYGVLGVHSRQKRRFTTDDAHFLASIANILAAAMEQARSEAAQRASEERFEVAFQSSPVAMTITTLAEGRYVAVNDRFLALCGYPREHLLGHTVRELHWWESPDQRAAVAEALKRSGQLRDLSLNFKASDGSLHEAMGSFALMDVAGTACVLSLFEDVSERRRLEAQLAQSQKMEAIGNLAGGIAHDFNNLLNVIVGYADLMRKALPDEVSPARRRIEQILKAAERATALTRQLLAFSRRQLLQPRVVDLSGVVRDIDSLVRRLIGENIELLLALEPQLGRVRIDPVQAEQVLLNLAINARDAMPDGGTLTIETANVELEAPVPRSGTGRAQGPYVVLRVRDTGHGMDADVQAHAFEPFFTTKPEGHGTGLGLATVYGIVQQSGGQISLESAPGRGTTFSVYLPRTEAPLSSAEESERSQVLLGSETVAVVEDEAEARSLIREVLQGYGYRVLVAGSGEEALTLLAAHAGPVDLLLTDVVMPGISGSVLWERARATRPGMKVLFMSGYTDEIVGRHGVGTEAVDLIEKPFRPEALVRRIRQVLADAGSG